MNYYLHLKSNFDALIEVNKLSLGLIKKHSLQPISLEVNDNYPLLLKLTPITYPEESEKLLPYLTKLNVSNGLIEVSNELVEVTHYPQNNYELFFNKNILYSYELPKVLGQNSYTIKGLSHTATIFFDGINQITIQDKELLFTHKIKEHIVSAEIEKIKNTDCILIKADTASNKIYVLMLAYSRSKYDIIKEAIINKIEEDEKTFVMLTKLNDMAGHALVEEGEILDNEFKLKDEYIVYLNEKAKAINLPELVPYAFLEAIKVSDFSLARSYLTEELSDSLQDAHLSAYFSDFVLVKPATYEKNSTNKIALIYEDKKRFAKIFKVEMEKNKITNFSES